MNRIFIRDWRTLLGVCIAVVMLFPLAWAFTQDEPITVDVTGVNATALPTVTVTTTVTDNIGQPIPDLTIENFSLGGDLANTARIVDVTAITDIEQALSVVLMIDTSSSMAGDPFEAAKAAARSFVENADGNFTIAIMTFDTDVQLVQDFTADKAVLNAAIDQLTFGGKTALYEAGVRAVQQAVASANPRRAVILLSDGAEFGEVSNAARRDALNSAITDGVPVYTVGLGFGTDRTYLRDLSEATNAQFYETPDETELTQIYNGIATTLRSQYVITIEADVPADGTEYPLVLDVTTPRGNGSTTTTLRAPIPTPLVQLPQIASPLEAALSAPITVKADQEVTTLAVNLTGPNDFAADGFLPLTATDNVAEYVSDPLSLEPQTLLPGDYTLTVTAADADGDVGEAVAEFTVPAFPTDFTVEAETTDTNVTLTRTIDLSQTPVTRTAYSVDGAGVIDFPADADSVTLDFLTLQPGQRSIEVTVTNEGGVTSSQVVTVDVPALVVLGLDSAVLADGSALADGGELLTSTAFTVTSETLQPGVEVTGTTWTLNGEALAVQDTAPFSVEIDPATLAPGEYTLAATSTNSATDETNTVELTFTVPVAASAATHTPDPAAAAATTTAIADATARAQNVNATTAANAAATNTANAAATSTANAAATTAANAAATSTANAAATTAANAASANVASTAGAATAAAANAASANVASTAGAATAAARAQTVDATTTAAAANAAANVASADATTTAAAANAAATQAAAAVNATGTNEARAVATQAAATQAAATSAASINATATATALAAVTAEPTAVPATSEATAEATALIADATTEAGAEATAEATAVAQATADAQAAAGAAGAGAAVAFNQIFIFLGCGLGLLLLLVLFFANNGRRRNS
jgi:VWFA-related protein